MQGSLVDFVSEKIGKASREIEKLEAWRNVKCIDGNCRAKVVEAILEGAKEVLGANRTCKESITKATKTSVYTYTKPAILWSCSFSASKFSSILKIKTYILIFFLLSFFKKKRKKMQQQKPASASDFMPTPPRVLVPVKDTQRKVKVNFKLKYVECDLAQKQIESKPVIQMYLSSHFNRTHDIGGVVNIRFDEDNLQKEYVGSLIGSLKIEHGKQVPITAAVGIGSYVEHFNDYGHSCYVNAGMTHVFLDEAAQAVKVQGKYDHNHDLLMKTVIVSGMEPLKKGVLEVCITSVELGPAISMDLNKKIMRGIRASAQRSEQVIEQYIQESMILEQRLPDLFKNTERVRVPMDISQTGVELTKRTFLPVASFGLIETPPTNEYYFQNAFERVMARKNMSVANYHDFDNKEKARTLAQILCYAVQSFDYIGDSAELSRRTDKFFARQKIGTEEFSDIFATLAGDCEDGGRGIKATLKAFLSLDNMKNPMLKEMQAIAHEYTPMLSLAVVHGAKIGDEEGLGAHMYMPVLPKDQFAKGLEKTSSGRELLKRLGDAVVPKIMDLPHLTCEGTGILDPVGRPQVLFEQYKYIKMNLPSFAGLKMEIPREEGTESQFYLGNYFGINADAIENHGINIGGYIFGTANPHHDPRDKRSAEMIRGCLFTDMINKKDTLAIMPQPIMSEEVMEYIQEAAPLRPPPRPLVLDLSKPLAGKEKNPDLDKFVAAVKGFKRVGKRNPNGPLNIILRPHHFNANLVQKMISDVAHAERVYDAEYNVEHITNSVYTYCLRLYVE